MSLLLLISNARNSINVIRQSFASIVSMSLQKAPNIKIFYDAVKASNIFITPLIDRLMSLPIFKALDKSRRRQSAENNRLL
jgi:hypothetical protein